MTARRAGAALVVAGTVLLAWVAVTALWREPFGALRAERAQQSARAELDALVAATRRETRAVAQPLRMSAGAAALRAGLGDGDAAGELQISRIGLRAVLVAGSSPAALRRGPGIYAGSPFPGEGGTVAIAGHRTTHGAPFRHIDRLRAGDPITLRMPYGLVRYRVRRIEVVSPGTVSALRRVRTGERLVLSACHPLFSADERLLVIARRTAVQN
ncbi:MAG: class E sortase [Baekduia sp.]